MTVAVRSAGGPFRRVRTTVGALDRWDAAALLGAAVLVMLVFFTFRQYGISNDEEVQNVYGKRLLSFYLSGFADDSAFTYKNLYLYGGLFDMAAVALEAVLPFDPYDTRHLLSGLIGVLGIAGVWLLARRLATPRAAVLAGLLLALTGPWYGGMFNHTKDVPFAAGMVWALYFLCRIIEELPRPQPGRVLVFGVAVGLSLGLRVGGVCRATGILAGTPGSRCACHEAADPGSCCRLRSHGGVLAMVCFRSPEPDPGTPRVLRLPVRRQNYLRRYSVQDVRGTAELCAGLPRN
jgi:hypothetical protein